jgi:tRNA uridine 5-carboxymethylaminomethyl modification enzyme
MMTSRAEFRLILREDNTLERLTGMAFLSGLISESQFSEMSMLLERRAKLSSSLYSKTFVPNAETQSKLGELNTAVLTKPISAADLLRREEVNCLDLIRLGLEIDTDERVYGPVEIEIKYSGYIQRQLEMVDQAKRMESYLLPTEIDYTEVRGLSREEVEKLGRVRPQSLGQAQRISGVNPSAIHAILVYLKGRAFGAPVTPVNSTVGISKLEIDCEHSNSPQSVSDI